MILCRCIDSFWVSLNTIERTLPSKAFEYFIVLSFNTIRGNKATKLKEVDITKLKDFTFDILFSDNLIITRRDKYESIIINIKEFKVH